MNTMVIMVQEFGLLDIGSAVVLFLAEDVLGGTRLAIIGPLVMR